MANLIEVITLSSGRRFWCGGSFSNELEFEKEVKALRECLSWDIYYYGDLDWAEMSPEPDTLAELVWLYEYAPCAKVRIVG